MDPGLDIERPWWRSAVILKSDMDRSNETGVSDVRMDQGSGGERLTKHEVLSRLQTILGDIRAGL
jgi:hypothetical protein